VAVAPQAALVSLQMDRAARCEVHGGERIVIRDAQRQQPEQVADRGGQRAIAGSPIQCGRPAMAAS
jgi:hypothetical protein